MQRPWELHKTVSKIFPTHFWTAVIFHPAKVAVRFVFNGPPTMSELIGLRLNSISHFGSVNSAVCAGWGERTHLWPHSHNRFSCVWSCESDAVNRLKQCEQLCLDAAGQFCICCCQSCVVMLLFVVLESPVLLRHGPAIAWLAAAHFWATRAGKKKLPFKYLFFGHGPRRFYRHDTWPSGCVCVCVGRGDSYLWCYFIFS